MEGDDENAVPVNVGPVVEGRSTAVETRTLAGVDICNRVTVPANMYEVIASGLTLDEQRRSTTVKGFKINVADAKEPITVSKWVLMKEKKGRRRFRDGWPVYRQKHNLGVGSVIRVSWDRDLVKTLKIEIIKHVPHIPVQDAGGEAVQVAADDGEEVQVAADVEEELSEPLVSFAWEIYLLSKQEYVDAGVCDEEGFEGAVSLMKMHEDCSEDAGSLLRRLFGED